ncbi:MAG TPA: type II toxin-antitoxin system CcdA family antitoxin [Longimicrobiales bacterium]|nr:type II toxin-antitoxin system CcdA family antitoxin [Longimicrobiales bacterium]
MTTTRVTVTLPAELVEEVDRLEKNRSRFVVEGVRREVRRRKREELRRSLATPHPESLELAEEGLAAWHESLPEEDATDLVDPAAGTAVRWRVGEGWVPDEA